MEVEAFQSQHYCIVSHLSILYRCQRWVLEQRFQYKRECLALWLKLNSRLTTAPEYEVS